MTDHELMKLAKKRVTARKGVIVHLKVCVTVSVTLVIIYLATSFGEYFWPIWPIIGLVISLAAHSAAIFPLYLRFNHEDKVKAEYDCLKQMYNDEKLQ